MRVSRQLSRDTLPRRLRRAVDLATVLSLSGCHWQGSTGTERDFSLSREVDSIDYFLSHDWGSSPTLKFIALVLIFNAAPAAVAAMVIALLVGCLEAAELLPTLRYEYNYRVGGELFSVRPGFLSFVVGLMTYVVCLVFWQRLRPLIAKQPITAFLDKLCIHQTDMRMKNAGILGLAGFLKDTRVIVILWSPRYFSRLWCTYEIAAWFMNGKLGRSRGTIFMPLHLAGVAALLMSCSFCTVLYDFTFAFEMQSDFSRYAEVFFLTLLYAHNVLMMWLARKLVRSLRKLPQQLSTFSIDESQCGCCNLDHLLADGTRIPCDRELILSTLETWMGEVEREVLPAPSDGADSDASDGSGLGTLTMSKLLSERISEQLSPLVSESRGAALMPYSLALKTCTVPVALYWTTWITVLWHLDSTSARLRIVGDILLMVFAQFPCMMRLTLVLAFLCESRSHTPFEDLAMTVWKVLLYEATTDAYHGLQLTAYEAKSPMLQIAGCVFGAALTCALFRPGLYRHRWSGLAANSPVDGGGVGIQLAGS